MTTAIRSRDIYGKTIIVIAPTTEETIEFKVVETDAVRAKMYAEELRAFAEYSGKSWQMQGNLVKIAFGNADEAEAACRQWYG